MSAFRDAIAQGVINGMDGWAGEADWQNFAADAILNTSEMQAIKEYVICVRTSNDGYDHLLPESVVDWVLDDD